MKRTALTLCLFIVLLAPIVPLVQSNLSLANAESSIPKPSVPEFTVVLVDSSYDVPTTYSIDPYTGENVTHLGYHVERTSIEVKINNQPFTPYKIQDSYGNNWTINFFYNIRIKGHFSGDWIELYNPSDGYLTPSDSQYTIISYVWGGDADTVMGTKMIKLPAGGQVDLQVEAMIGYVSRSGDPPWYSWVFTGETSGWSNTQTITIDGSASATTPTSSPSQYPTATPEPSGDANQQGSNWTEICLLAALGVIAALLVVIALMRRKLCAGCVSSTERAHGGSLRKVSALFG